MHATPKFGIVEVHSALLTVFGRFGIIFNRCAKQYFWRDSSVGRAQDS